MKTAAKSDDVESMKAALHELEQASHALSRTLYAKTGAAPGVPGADHAGEHGAGPMPGDGHPAGAPTGSAEDEPIDAEFEVK